MHPCHSQGKGETRMVSFRLREVEVLGRNRKLIEQIWMLTGIASTCRNISELYDRMAEKHGRVGVQYRLYLPPPGSR